MITTLELASKQIMTELQTKLCAKNNLANTNHYLMQLPFITRFGHEWHDRASIIRGIPTVSLKSSATCGQQNPVLTHVMWHR